MLRVLLVYMAAAGGMFYALQGPFYALLFYTWNAYFRPEGFVWDYQIGHVHLLKLSLVSGLLAVGSALISKQKFVWTGRCNFVFGFLLFTLLSTLLSVDSQLSFRFWADFCKALIITYLYLVLVTDVRKLRLLIVVMTLSLGILEAKQGLQGLMTGDLNQNENLFLGDNNGLAIGMLMLFPMFGLLAQTCAPEKRWRKRGYLLLAVGVFCRAIVTYSRGAMLAAGAMVGVYWLRSKNKLRNTVLLGALVAAILSTMPKQWWARMETTFSPKTHNEASALSRFHFWKIAVDMANDNPVFGVGFSAYNAAFDNYDPVGKHAGERSVHSSWFGVLAECGYVGLLQYILILFLAWRSLQRVKKRAKEDPRYEELAKYATALETAIVPFVVAGAFVIFQYNEMIWNFLGLTLVLDHFVRNKRYEEIYPEAGKGDLTAEGGPQPPEPTSPNRERVLEGV